MNPSTNAVLVTISDEWLKQTIVYNAIGSVFTGVVSGLLMSLVVWWIIRRVEKGDTFREIVLPVLRTIEEAKTATEVAENYKASIRVVRDAAAKFSSYIIRPWKRRAFDATWRKYCGIKEDALEPRWDIVNYPEDLPKILAAPTRVEASQEIVRWLNDLIRLSGIHK
jgi:hypothetical protein